ncbi:MAG: hypothetical protein LBG79_02040 [Spirochaetaceae bacterium]|jgi:hypothetical protein|nr:hypothetical protein [Spirochaetaceae bacterium]GMO28723.1 MAG: hypothetical protein Pg6A_16690 [Termitinemataceae bacterium]
MKTRIALALFFLPFCGFALDFGIFIENEFFVESSLIQNNFNANPWFNVKFDKQNKLSFFLSFELFNKNKNSEHDFISSFGLTYFSYNPLPCFNILFGRLHYSDKALLIADGVFDGFTGELRTAPFKFTVSAFYTGLLQKEQTKIIMNRTDFEEYEDSKNYYTPKKIFVSAETEIKDVFGYRNQININYITLYDINRNDGFDSQYLLLSAGFPFFSDFSLFISSATGFAKNAGQDMLHHAAKITLDYKPAFTLPDDVFSFCFLWSSGRGDGGSGAWTSISFFEQGEAFKAPFTNLAAACIFYKIKFLKLANVDSAFRWFFRTSNELPITADINTGNEMFIGQELAFNADFILFSDFAFNSGFGIFIPQPIYGEALGFVLWKFKLTVKIQI